MLARLDQSWDLSQQKSISFQTRTRARLHVHLQAESSCTFETTIEDLEKSFLLGNSSLFQQQSLNEPGEILKQTFNLPNYTTVQVDFKEYPVKKGDGNDCECLIAYNNQQIRLFAKGGQLCSRRILSEEKTSSKVLISLYDWE